MLSSCSNPKLIKNANGDYMTVPCGVCDNCLNSYSTSWTKRLDREVSFTRQGNGKVLFGTLTYSDEFLSFNKVFIPHDKDNSVRIVDQFGVCFDYDYQFIQENDPFNYEFIKCFKKVSIDDEIDGYDGYLLPVPSVPDIQNFIKRIRSDFSYRKKGESLRYFFCSEYGETTFRPHWHFIVFTRSFLFDDDPSGVVNKYWSSDRRGNDVRSFGKVSCEFVKTSATSYVTGYLNSFSRQPGLLNLPPFRRKLLYSRSPSIGSLPIIPETIKELFYSRVVSYAAESSLSGFVEKALPQDIYRRLYPRFPGYSKVSPSLFYRCLEFGRSMNVSTISFREFLSHVDFEIESTSDDFEFFRTYLYNLRHSRGLNLSSLHQLFSFLRKTELLCSVLGCSHYYYSLKYREFFENLDYFRLVDAYRLLEAEPPSSPVSSLIFDYGFVHRVISNPDDFRVRKILSYRKISPSDVSIFFKNKSFNQILSQESPSFSSYSGISSLKMYYQKEAHFKNDYLYGDRSNLSPDYRRFLIKFHSSKKNIKQKWILQN